MAILSDSRFGPGSSRWEPRLDEVGATPPPLAPTHRKPARLSVDEAWSLLQRVLGGELTPEQAREEARRMAAHGEGR